MQLQPDGGSGAVLARRRPVLAAVLVALAAGMATHASAQSVALEEITVTAQKREQRLEDVPISVSVTTGESISDQNIVSLYDLANNTPAFSVVQGGPSDVLVIRGVFSGNNAGFEQAVGTFVDGIYHGRSRFTRAAFLDVERIEVLRGPQSTFFGMNAIAGALNISTRRPGDQFEGFVSALYEPDHGEYDAMLALGGPLTDTLGLRIALKKWGMSDGWITTLGGQDGPQGDDLFGRATLVWEPNEAFTASLKVEAGQADHDVSRPTQLVHCPPDPASFPAGARGFCPAALAAGDDTVLDDRRSLGPGGENDSLDTREYVLTLDLETHGHNLTSITGWSEYDFESRLEIDGTSLRLFNVFVDEGYEQLSQEFRIASPSGGRFEYMGGVYWQEDEIDASQEFTYYFLTPVISGIPPFAAIVPYLPIASQNRFQQEDETISVFGSLTWNVSDAVRVAAGLRWMKVDKDFTQQISFATGTQDFGGLVGFPANVATLGDAVGTTLRLAKPGLIVLSRSDDEVLPSINVQFDVGADAMLYASYARGFKAGGFDAQSTLGNPALLPYSPEMVDAFEVGLKGTWFGGALQTSLALFRSEYDDLQESTSQLQGAAVIFAVSNVAAMRSQGMELEARWAITERVSAEASLVYLDARYESYPNAGCTAAQTVAVAPASCTQDLSGRHRPFSPEFSGNLRLRHLQPLSARLQLRSEVGLYFTDGYFLAGDLDPALVQDSYASVDARLSLGSPDDRWDVSVIGKNLTDRTILGWGSDQPTSPGSFIVLRDRPRSIAIQARYRW
jgi:outer membrane receptor protein involved in Fe transport